MFGMQLRPMLATTEFRPRIFQLFIIVDSIRCKVKMGFSEDTLDPIWPYVVEPLNDGAKGVFSVDAPGGGEWPRKSYQYRRRGERVCDGNFRFVVWIVTGKIPQKFKIKKKTYTLPK